MPVESSEKTSPCHILPNGYNNAIGRRVSEWLAASLEMRCLARGCGFDSRALRLGTLRFGGLGQFTQDAISYRLLPSCALFSRTCSTSWEKGLSAPCPPNSPSAAVYNDAFSDALVPLLLPPINQHKRPPEEWMISNRRRCICRSSCVPLHTWFFVQLDRATTDLQYRLPPRRCRWSLC